MLKGYTVCQSGVAQKIYILAISAACESASSYQWQLNHCQL